MKGMCVVAALLALGLVAPGPAGEPGSGAKPAGLPGDARWDYAAWADDYLVTATAYDADTRQVTWTLEARKKLTAQPYQARFTDPDLIELETRAIEMTPARKEYAKGNRIKAVLKLPSGDVIRETNRVTISSPP